VLYLKGEWGGVESKRKRSHTQTHDKNNTTNDHTRKTTPLTQQRSKVACLNEDVLYLKGEWGGVESKRKRSHTQPHDKNNTTNDHAKDQTPHSTMIEGGVSK